MAAFVSEQTQLRAGEEIAGYWIEGLAGRGGMGEVYRATDRRLDRSVALKLLAPKLAADERFRERFLRESRVAASLDHPNVIPVYEAGEAEGRLFIAMRFVEGTDLRERLRAEHILDPRPALAVLAPVAGALDTAHARGLVHRDVKPGNILIAVEPGADPPEHVYLSDFGLTTLASEPSDAGPFTGTADYAAPELVTGGHVDGRSDLYGLGCVLFECLTGEPPFRGDSVMSVLWGHVNDPIPVASGRNPSLPNAIDAVFRRALAKEPSKRYATCRELIDSARAALGLRGDDDVSPARRRHRGVAAAAAAVLAAAALLGVLLSTGTTSRTGGGALVRVGLAGHVGKPIAVGDGPSAVGVGSHSVWVAAGFDGSLWRVDPQTQTPTIVPGVGAPTDVAVFGDRVYVASEGPGTFSGNVARYDATDGQRLDDTQFLACSIAAGVNGVWAAGCPNVNELAPSGKLRVLATIPIPFWSPHDTTHDRGELSQMALGEGAVWILGDATDPRVWRIDPASRRITATFVLPFTPAHLAVGQGGVWITDQLDDAVVRLDPRSGRVVARIPVGRGASGVAVGGGSVWATSYIAQTVSRIDPESNRVVARFSVPERPRDDAFGAGALWVVGDED